MCHDLQLQVIFCFLWFILLKTTVWCLLMLANCVLYEVELVFKPAYSTEPFICIFYAKKFACGISLSRFPDVLVILNTSRLDRTKEETAKNYTTHSYHDYHLTCHILSLSYIIPQLTINATNEVMNNYNKHSNYTIEWKQSKTYVHVDAAINTHCNLNAYRNIIQLIMIRTWILYTASR